MNDRTGQQFGSYRLLRLLGRGGFAEVYLGQHLRLASQQAAIKILSTHLNETDIRAFEQEAETIAALVHPHIIRVLDFDVQAGVPFLVMDYAPNGSLRQRHRTGEQVALATVLTYVQQVGDGLQYAHDQKRIHRDIKPDNVLIGRRGEILLSDFGIATIAHSTTSQSAQAAIGTIAYMAPERMQEHPRPASDQYALAITAYEWLVGERPFSGTFAEMAVKHVTVPPPPLRAKRPELPSALEQVVLTALAKDPKERFSSVEAFARALQEASAAPASIQTVMAPGVPAAPPLVPPTQPARVSATPGTPAAPPLVLSTQPVRASTTPVVPPLTTLAPTTSSIHPEETKAVTESTTSKREGPFTSPVRSAQPAVVRKDRSTGQDRSTSSRNQVWQIVVFCLVIVLIVSSIIGGVTYQNHADSVAATATALNATATIEADLNAQSTATASVIQATATVLAANPYPSYMAGSGKIAVLDYLNEWSSGSSSCPASTSSNLRLQEVATSAYPLYSRCISKDRFSNFAIEVQMAITGEYQGQQGDCGGIMFRLSQDSQKFYFFEVCSNGYYRVWLYTIDSSASSLLSSGYTASIDQHSGATNTLGVVANGSSMDFYINKASIATVNNSNYSSGYIALCDLSRGNATYVTYTNARVWT